MSKSDPETVIWNEISKSSATTPHCSDPVFLIHFCTLTLFCSVFVPVLFFLCAVGGSGWCPVSPKSPPHLKITGKLSKSFSETWNLSRTLKVIRYDLYCSGPVFLIDFHIVTLTVFATTFHMPLESRRQESVLPKWAWHLSAHAGTIQRSIISKCYLLSQRAASRRGRV